MTLQEIAIVLRRALLVLIVGGLLGASSGATIALLSPSQYSTSATLSTISRFGTSSSELYQGASYGIIAADSIAALIGSDGFQAEALSRCPSTSGVAVSAQALEATPTLRVEVIAGTPAGALLCLKSVTDLAVSRAQSLGPSLSAAVPSVQASVLSSSRDAHYVGPALFGLIIGGTALGVITAAGSVLTRRLNSRRIQSRRQAASILRTDAALTLDRVSDYYLQTDASVILASFILNTFRKSAPLSSVVVELLPHTGTQPVLASVANHLDDVTLRDAFRTSSPADSPTSSEGAGSTSTSNKLAQQSGAVSAPLSFLVTDFNDRGAFAPELADAERYLVIVREGFTPSQSLQDLAAYCNHMSVELSGWIWFANSENRNLRNQGLPNIRDKERRIDSVPPANTPTSAPEPRYRRGNGQLHEHKA